MKIVKYTKIGIIVWILGVVAMISLVGSIISSWKKKHIVKEREVILRHVEGENQQFKKQLEEAQTPAFIEKAARDKLGLVKPGEIVVLLGKPVATGSVSLRGPREESANWKQWWKLFF